jgi:hypothetical protein
LRKAGFEELDDPAPIRAALVEMASGWGVERPLETAQIFAQWERVVGSELARRCRPTSLKGGVLRVRMESAAWASEIRYLGEEIIERINRVVGSKVVAELRPWVATRKDEGALRGRAAEPEPRSRAQPHEPAAADPRVGQEIQDQALAKALKRAFSAAQKTGR